MLWLERLAKILALLVNLAEWFEKNGHAQPDELKSLLSLAAPSSAEIGVAKSFEAAQQASEVADTSFRYSPPDA